MNALALALLTLVAGCLPPLTPAVTNVTDLRYRARAQTNSTIDLYRFIGSRSGSVTSRCKMVPTDSEMFTVRANRCGGVAAWYWGVSRVLLEQAASSAFVPHLRLDGRWRWVDLPGDRCSP
ncbi:MAG: hypothetical protein JWP01_3944 [Myxococcales bacterium]|nr:hypothetical protein [Myxococcales bacterium]